MKNDKHPCFEFEAKHQYGRVHLPVAPKCNVQCNYCDRKFDCMNESRPGVSSAILSPSQALEYLKVITTKTVKIAVIGIAGPGDPLANPDETFETIKLAKKNFPDMIFCLSTNGLELSKHVDTLAELGVTHITITINTLNPEIAGTIFSWVRYNKKVYRGLEAGKVMVAQQLEGLRKAVAKGFTVKINSIIMPTINDKEIPLVAKTVAEMGAYTLNCIPLYRNAGTVFENVPEPTDELIKALQNETEKYLKPMKHCSRCRADAAGLLGQDMPESMELIQEFAKKPLVATEKRPYVAVASEEGIFVNQHLGEAEFLRVYSNTENEGYKLIGERKTPMAGSGDQRWIDLAKTLPDCSALLVSGAGQTPTFLLKSMGIRVIQMNGLIEDGLESVYKGTPLKCSTTKFKCGDSCGGSGTGCG